MRVIFDQCDSTEEVCGLFNKVFANQEQMEAKIIQNAQEIEALKPKKKIKKKGSAMKSKGFALTRVLAVLLLVVAITGLCYAAYVPGDITYEIADNPEMLATYLRDVTSNMASYSYLFTPLAAAPQAATGRVYYNSGTNRWVGYNGTAWLNFDIAGGVTLDGAYDSGGAGLGRTINVNDGALVFTNNELDDADILQLTHTGAGATRGLLVTINGTEPAIEIENTSTGYDIEGTGATWYATNGGTIVGVAGDLTGAAGLTLQNDETITNAADGKITFTTNGGTANTLLLDLQAGATAIQLESGDVTEFQFGDVDDLTQVGNITFDQAAAAITLTANAGAEDLTITQAGAVDASVYIHSAGTELDAIKITTDGDGGIDVDADEDISITVTSDAGGEDLLLTQSGAQDASIILTSDGTGDDAIKLETTAVTGDIWIDTGDDLVIDVAGFLDLDLVGAFDLDGAAGVELTSSEGNADSVIITSTAGGIDILAVNTNAAGEDIDITLTGATDSSIDLSSSGTGADAIIAAATAGGIDIDAALGITIDNAGAASDIVITSALGSVNIIATENAADSILIQSSVGGIDIDAAAATSEDIDITNTGGSINLVATESAVDSIKLQSTLGGIDIQCDAATSEDIDISNTGGSINLVATENAADSIKLQSTLGGIDILCDASGAEDIDISNTGGSVHIVSDLAGTTAFNLDVTGANGGVDIDTTNGPIVMTTAGAVNGDVTIDASDKISIISSDADAAGILVQVDGGAAETIHINSTAGTTASAIYLDADVGGITLLADGAVAGDILIDAEDKITIISYDQDADGIDIGVPATGHANSTIHIHNETGTATDAIEVLADVGGITLMADGAAAGDITIDAEDRITLTTEDEDAGAITVGVAAGGAAASTMVFTNTPGTAEDAITLTSTAGGIDINANAGKNITVNGGQILIEAEESAASAISLITNTGVLETIVVTNTAGTDNAAIDIEATLGGIDIDSTKVINIQGDLAAASAIVVNASAGGMDIDANGDDMNITLTADAANEDLTIKQDGAQDAHIIIDSVGTSIDSIYLHEHSAGTAAGIKIHADAGTAVADGAASVQLLSDVGGIGIKAGVASTDGIWINSSGGGVHVDAVDDIDIQLTTGGADGEDVLISNTGGGNSSIVITSTGTGSDAIWLDSNGAAGDVDIDSADDITLDALNILANTTDTALQMRFDAQGAVAGNAIEVETTDGRIQIFADGATDGDIILTSTDDIQVTVGGHLRVVDDDLMAFGTDDDVTLNYDEDGDDVLQIIGPVEFETTYCQFDTVPLFAAWQSAAAAFLWGGAATGATGDENIMVFPEATAVYHILGAGTLELGPQMRAGGFDISLEDAADEGLEIVLNAEPIVGGGKDNFTARTDACYLLVKIYVTDVSGTDDLCVGFRKAEAFNAGVNGYTDYALLRLNAGDIYIESDLNGAAANSDDTNDNWADTTAVTLGIFVDGSGNVTYTIDGSAPTATQTFQFDTGDILVPFVFLLHTGDFAELTYLQSWECGLQ